MFRMTQLPQYKAPLSAAQAAEGIRLARENAARLIDAGEPAAQVARDMGMSRATLYRRLRDIQRADAAAAISS